MIKKIKEYLEYRRNHKTAKRELAKIAAAVLPTAREVSENITNIAGFVIKLTNETKNADGKEFMEMVIDKTAGLLNIDNNRIIQILTYMANLSPEDIQKIVVHSVVETIPGAGADNA